MSLRSFFLSTLAITLLTGGPAAAQAPESFAPAGPDRSQPQTLLFSP